MKDYSLMFLRMAEETAEQSNCVKYKTGAVVVRDSRIVLQGYNGTISGFENCSEKFKHFPMTENSNRLAHRIWSEAYEVHAEMNVITYAARKGIPLQGTIMYCTHKPCANCVKHLIQAGIKKVIYLHEFPGKTALSDESIKDLLIYIEITKFHEEGSV